MTLTELAGHLEISKGQASKLAAAGMPTDSVEAARQWRRDNLRPEWSKESRDTSAATPGRGSGSADEYWQAKARKESAQAKLAELELARELRRVCVVDDVHRSLYSVHRMLRDQLLSIPNRIASEVGGLAPHAAAELMRAELRRCLQEFEGLATAALENSTGKETQSTARS